MQLYELPHTLRNIALAGYLLFTNLTMFFQEGTLFLAIRNDLASFTTNPTVTQFFVGNGLAVPQAWSLGVELSFYLLAPFLLKQSNKRLLVAAGVSLLLKAAFISFVIDRDPWTYRFFPFELGWFLVGALVYRKKDKLASLFGFINNNYKVVVSYLMVFILTTCSLSGVVIHLMYPALFALIIPFIFSATARIKFDTKIGELSYPFYIFHLVCLQMVYFLLKRTSGAPFTQVIALTTLVFTIACSYIAWRIEEKTIEPLRRNFSNSIPRDIVPCAPYDTVNPEQDVTITNSLHLENGTKVDHLPENNP